MAKSETKPNNAPHLMVIVILILAVAAMAYLYAQKAGAYTQETNAYGSINSNYTNLKGTVSTLQSQLASVRSQLASNNSLLSSLQYNLTHPYMMNLENKKVIGIGPATYNYTVQSWEPSSYNFSFNAPYPGYLIVNYSAAPINNNLENSTFVVYVSTEKPYYSTGVLNLNAYVEPYVRYSGPNSQTAMLPVINGTNYVVMTNYNNVTATVEFSIKYVGFHTS